MNETQVRAKNGKNSVFIARGLEVICQAIDADSRGEYMRSLDLYKLGIHLLSMGKSDTKEHAVNTVHSINDNVGMYIHRAKQIHDVTPVF